MPAETYPCNNCPAVFSNFPAAHNHELAHDYKHLTLRHDSPATELAVCALSGCFTIKPVAECVWSEDGEDPYCSAEHHAEGHTERFAASHGATR